MNKLFNKILHYKARKESCEIHTYFIHFLVSGVLRRKCFSDFLTFSQIKVPTKKIYPQFKNSTTQK